MCIYIYIHVYTYIIIIIIIIIIIMIIIKLRQLSNPSQTHKYCTSTFPPPYGKDLTQKSPER